MAEERGGTNPAWKSQPASWTKLFGTFLVALDPFKLLVAAAGILVTALGWWLLSVIFYSAWNVPNLDTIRLKANKDLSEADRESWAQAEYAKSLDTWALMHELAGPTERSVPLYAEYYQKRHPEGSPRNPRLTLGYGGKYRTMPWAENRGPNPYLLTRTMVGGSGPERRYVLGQFGTYQAPNLIEPLLKFLTPVYYLTDARATFWVYVYLLLLIIWLLVVWAFFGGVITRMAVLQLSGKEGGGVREAIAYVKRRYLSYFLSPAVPILLIGFLVFCCMLFGIIHWIPGLGDFWDGLLWPLPLLAGLVITLLLIGMVGYPMMYTTLSAEGSDTFDALSRSYNYVYESPWHYIWYSIVAIIYGAVLTLFVVTAGSLTTYFAKWGVSKFPAWGADRSPEYLFVYSPESLGWRKLLTDGSPAAINDMGEPINPAAYEKYMKEYAWYNEAGAAMTSFWIHLVFLMVIGFSYSYFWTASTQIYLLMRKRVDETELDEVYVEEEAPAAPVMPSSAPAAAPVPTPTGPLSVPVDPPTLKQPEPATAPSQSTVPPADTPPGGSKPGA
ncbi:MAG TPA: hypothetical protein VHR66_11480 [Gemmataceae bacterium]|jgi:hypothetical protein|nr:hypothetical protein [Gemmataceae bacterium]